MIQTNNKKFPFRSYQGKQIKPEEIQRDFEQFAEFELKKYRDLIKSLNDELDAVRARLTTLENA